MSQTVLTHSELIHLIQWKLNGFIQLDLFPEELEQAKREQITQSGLILSTVKREKQNE
jgi:hypothetical protein